MAETALDQKLGTLLRMHEEAFRQLEGVPEEILYDRMKSGLAGNRQPRRDCLASGVSGLRALLGRYTTIVSALSGANEGQS